MELFIARNKFTIPVENVEIVHEPLWCINMHCNMFCNALKCYHVQNALAS
jgi:hypothetical protein